MIEEANVLVSHHLFVFLQVMPDLDRDNHAYYHYQLFRKKSPIAILKAQSKLGNQNGGEGTRIPPILITY